MTACRLRVYDVCLGCSHYVCIPPGMLPSDILMTSPIIQGEGGAPVAHFSEFGGVDPTMDPELAAVRATGVRAVACCAGSGVGGWRAGCVRRAG